MDWIRAIEIFAFVTGIIYVIFEVMQKRVMWVVGILTSTACAWSFGVQHLWASMGLNIYYVIVSVWGIVQWSLDEKKLSPSDDGAIHLTRLSLKTALLSLGIFVVGTALLILLLNYLNDSESALDAGVTVLSAIGTWWLAKSYKQQWIVFIVADVFSTLLCAISGMWPMALLYLVYIAAAFYGLYHWTKKGVYV